MKEILTWCCCWWACSLGSDSNSRWNKVLDSTTFHLAEIQQL